MPLSGVTNTEACLAPGVRFSRIITPALVQGSTFATLATRATIVPSPLIVRYAYWNSSAVPQMSAPDPSILKTPASYAALPALATLPMSRFNQPVGSDDTGGGASTALDVTSTESNVAVAMAPSSTLDTASPM